jgi:hypothetical protein
MSKKSSSKDVVTLGPSTGIDAADSRPSTAKLLK